VNMGENVEGSEDKDCNTTGTKGKRKGMQAVGKPKGIRGKTSVVELIDVARKKERGPEG